LHLIKIPFTMGKTENAWYLHL